MTTAEITFKNAAARDAFAAEYDARYASTYGAFGEGGFNGSGLCFGADGDYADLVANFANECETRGVRVVYTEG